MMGNHGRKSTNHDANELVHLEATSIVKAFLKSGEPWKFGKTSKKLAKEVMQFASDKDITFMKLGKGNKWYPATKDSILETMKTKIREIKRNLESVKQADQNMVNAEKITNPKPNDLDSSFTLDNNLSTFPFMDDYDQSVIFPEIDSDYAETNPLPLRPHLDNVNYNIGF